jgi:acetylornithine deacetylase/succinyl-diaminopimelate desuccinylase-like protein
MADQALQDEAIRVLQDLVRFNTVNPPGNERAAIEYLEAYVR